MQPVFRSTDTGAPALSNANGSLVNVLDAILVDGYGALAPLGWALAFTGTNKRVYQQGAGSGFMLRIDDSANVYNARTYGAESFSDIDTPSGAFPTSTQFSGGLYLQKTNNSAGNRAWCAWGDAKRFYLFIDITGLGGYNGFFFGDIASYKASDAYACAIIGKHENRTDTNSDHLGSLTASSGAYGSLSGHYMARAHTGAGSSIAVNKYCDMRHMSSTMGMGNAGNSTLFYPDPISGGLQLSRVFIGEGGSGNWAPRGYLPGIWNVCHNRSSMAGVANGDTFSGSDGLASRSFELRQLYGNNQDGCVAMETSDWLESA